MQKILAIMVVCILGGLVFGQASDSRLILNEVVLANVEALAELEWVKPSTYCLGSGDLTCPEYGEKVKDVYRGYSLEPDEENY
ncbi:MAG: hypothetical protein J6B82_06800 [Bacteroidaceae bacterium]|nr:hypothetical protein [Bacteroidaceae bacterium]